MKTTYRKPAARRADPRRRLVLPGLALAVTLVISLLVSLLPVAPEDGAPALPQTGTSAGAWMKNDQGYYFDEYGQPILAATLKGIDVSHHQGTVDWEKAKAMGIDFAILRCGFGSEWDGTGNVADYNQDDACWEQNADACTRLGIPFGVYLYSYATTEEMARSEATHVARLLGLIEPTQPGLPSYTAKGYQPSYPIYYDLEDPSITGLFPQEMAALVTAFFDQLSQYGYQGPQGLYASLNWVRARFDDPAFDPWRDNLWIARYNTGLGYTGTYSMWQATYQAPGADYGVQSETVDVDFIMEDLTLVGITGASGKVVDPTFTNDTTKCELALGQEGDRATLVTDEPGENDGGQIIYWSSDNEEVATVSRRGEVRAVAPGQCTVTATLADGRTSARCIVRVGDITVPIYATGQLRGNARTESLSLADLAALKATSDDALLVDTGGSLQGSKNNSLTGGMDMAEALGDIGYHLQCFDASDLAYGYERLLQDAQATYGETLAANLRNSQGVPLFYRSTSWNRNRITNGMNAVLKSAGKRIGFFALSSLGSSAQDGVLSAADPVQTAAEQVAALRAESVDAVVCLIGADTDYAPLLDSLADLGVDAVIAGKAVDPVPDAPLTVVPAGGGLNAVGCLRLTFTAQGTLQAEASTTRADVASDLQPDAYQQASEALDSLDAGDEQVRSQVLFTHQAGERTIQFGNYVAQTYLALAEADRSSWPADCQEMTPLALAGGVGELPLGEITRGTLVDLLPAPQRLQLVLTTGAMYQELLNSATVSETYTNSLIQEELDPQAPLLLVTDTGTLRSMSDQSYQVLRDYGDAFWCVRMAINDATAGFTQEFVLPEAPRYGVGRGDVTG